jgi:hypothetical protein
MVDDSIAVWQPRSQGAAKHSVAGHSFSLSDIYGTSAACESDWTIKIGNQLFCIWPPP